MMPPATPSARTRPAVTVVVSAPALPRVSCTVKLPTGIFAPMTPPTKWTPSTRVAATVAVGRTGAVFRPIMPPTASPSATIWPRMIRGLPLVLVMAAFTSL